MIVVVHALSSSMARPLNKRQRKEVQAIVRQTISPEWKLFEGRTSLASIDLASQGEGIKVFDSIVEGAGASDRVGDSIRVHRIDCWVVLYKPQAPSQPSPIGVDAIFYRRETDESIEMKSHDSFFDTTLFDGNTVEGPYPMKRDLKLAGIHIKWRKRWRMRGIPVTYDQAYAQLVAPNVPIVRQSVETVAAYVTTGAGAQNVPAHNITVPVPHIRDGDIGSDYHQFHKAFMWRGGGLKVQYSNLLISGTREQNHMYMLFASQNTSGEAIADPTKCPRMAMSWRVYYTDD